MPFLEGRSWSSRYQQRYQQQLQQPLPLNHPAQRLNRQHQEPARAFATLRRPALFTKTNVFFDNRFFLQELPHLKDEVLVESETHYLLHLITGCAATQIVQREGEGRKVPLRLATGTGDPRVQSRQEHDLWPCSLLAPSKGRDMAVYLFASGYIVHRLNSWRVASLRAERQQLWPWGLKRGRVFVCKQSCPEQTLGLGRNRP